MKAIVLICGNVFDGVSDDPSGPPEILVEDNPITKIGGLVERPPDARVIDPSGRTVSPTFIDTHVHLTMEPRTFRSRRSSRVPGNELPAGPPARRHRARPG